MASSTRFNSLQGTSAFTLMEMLVALAIMAVIVVAGIASLPQFLGARSLDAAVSDTISLLEEARQLTLASKDPNPNDATVEGSQYGVYFATTTMPHKAYLFQGSSCDPNTSCTIKKTVEYISVDISGLTFANNALKNSVVFNRLTGATNNSGQIVFQTKKACEIRGISVANQGHISSKVDFKNQGWSTTRRVSITNPVATTLYNFPLLMRITAADNVSGTQSAGQDLRFTDQAGSIMLDHEIESWTSGGNSYVWVRIPLLCPGENKINMSYGNVTAVDVQNKVGVWDKDFVGVWHLSESGNTIYNSVSSSHSGTKTGTLIPVNTPIGVGTNFPGANNYITIPHALELQMPSALTVQLWFKTSDLPLPDNSRRIMIAKGNLGGFDSDFLIGFWRSSSFCSATATYCFDAQKKGLGVLHRLIPGSPGVSDFINGQYYHIVNAWDGAYSRLYLAGNLVGGPVAKSASSVVVTTYPLYFGRDLSAGTLFTGVIDEVWVSRVSRSADWIKASYENQKSCTSNCFVTIE